MGMVMVKCPQTGHAIPTGIKTDRESFGRRTVFFSRTRCPLCRTDHAGLRERRGSTSRASTAQPRGRNRYSSGDENDWGIAMTRMQILAEPPSLLMQAKDFLDEARRLKPGPARNELRETAKVLRELAKLEAASVGGREPYPAEDRY